MGKAFLSTLLCIIHNHTDQKRNKINRATQTIKKKKSPKTYSTRTANFCSFGKPTVIFSWLVNELGIYRNRPLRFWQGYLRVQILFWEFASGNWQPLEMLKQQNQNDEWSWLHKDPLCITLFTYQKATDSGEVAVSVFWFLLMLFQHKMDKERYQYQQCKSFEILHILTSGYFP